jgi:hypothetical protein
MHVNWVALAEICLVFGAGLVWAIWEWLSVCDECRNHEKNMDAGPHTGGHC